MSFDSLSMSSSTTAVYTPISSSSTSEFEDRRSFCGSSDNGRDTPSLPESSKMTKAGSQESATESPSPHPPTLQELSKAFNLRQESRLSKEMGDFICNIYFAYSSNTINGVKHGRDTWTASLMVFAPDVPRLMREGFYWSSKNIVPEFNAVGTLCKWQAHDYPDNSGRVFGVPKNRKTLYDNRRYLLTDLSKECRWTACLTVSSACNHLHVLSNFRPEELTRQNLDLCIAFNNNTLIYNYTPFIPRTAINAIYDDMPLEGRWPWPKQKKRWNGSGKGNEANAASLLERLKNMQERVERVLK